MRILMRTRVVVLVLAIVLPPYAAASEAENPGSDAPSSTVVNSGRADEMSAWSVDAGGGQSSGGVFELTAAIGQPDAGVVAQGGTALAGGLWAGAVDSGSIFSNGFESGDTGSWSVVVGGTF